MDRNPIGLTGLAISLLLFSGCGQAVAPAPKVGMANPASVYCAQQGGKSERVTTAAGQSSNCHLPDGRVVEEWALYRSTHAADATASAADATASAANAH